jgi:hypothetical protein
MTKPRVCKECEPRKKPLDAPYTGPRCYRHHKVRERELKARAHERHVGNTYSLPPGFYKALLEHQGGRCYWCQLAMGKSSLMPVDHDHSCCPGPTSCGKCVRGILCHDCNTFLGFRMRDDPETIKRGARYLTEPPAQALLMSWTPD